MIRRYQIRGKRVLHPGYVIILFQWYIWDTRVYIQGTGRDQGVSTRLVRLPGYRGKVRIKSGVYGIKFGL